MGRQLKFFARQSRFGLVPSWRDHCHKEGVTRLTDAGRPVGVTLCHPRQVGIFEERDKACQMVTRHFVFLS